MTVPAPAVNTWDVEAVAAAAAVSVLGMGGGDDDVATVRRLAGVATGLIDVELDRCPPAVDADPFDAGSVGALFEAAVQVTIDLYQRKDVTSDGSPALLGDGFDPLVGVRPLLAGQKKRWGIA